MTLAVKAWQLRQSARAALEAARVAEAQQAHRTPEGERLRLLCAWLASCGAVTWRTL